MSDDSLEIIYEPDEPEEDDMIDEDAKKRGAGRIFNLAAEDDSVQGGFEAMEKYNDPIKTWIKE